jgi:hypothetical protein
MVATYEKQIHISIVPVSVNRGKVCYAPIAEKAMSKQPNDPIKLQLRLNEALRQQIAAAAASSIRSINSEILYRLRSSFEREPSGDRAS